MQDLTTFIAQHMGLTYAFAVVLILLMIVEYLRAKRNNICINTAQAIQVINRQNGVVIDLRGNEAYRQGHIIDSLSLTQQEIEKNPKKIEKYRAKPLILVCQNGNDSQKVAALLLKQGYNAYSLAGGMRAWSEAEMPLVKE